MAKESWLGSSVKTVPGCRICVCVRVCVHTRVCIQACACMCVSTCGSCWEEPENDLTTISNTGSPARSEAFSCWSSLSGQINDPNITPKTLHLCSRLQRRPGQHTLLPGPACPSCSVSGSVLHKPGHIRHAGFLLCIQTELTQRK